VYLLRQVQMIIGNGADPFVVVGDHIPILVVSIVHGSLTIRVVVKIPQGGVLVIGAVRYAQQPVADAAVVVGIG
jgi:hypothetical protein